MEGNIVVANILLQYGALINVPITSKHFGNALAAACQSKLTNHGQLLGHGTDVNMVLEHGQFSSSLAAAICGKEK